MSRSTPALEPEQTARPPYLTPVVLPLPPDYRTTKGRPRKWVTVPVEAWEELLPIIQYARPDIAAAVDQVLAVQYKREQKKHDVKLARNRKRYQEQKRQRELARAAS